MSYRIFARTWWRRNSDWSDNLEPHAGPKTYIGTAADETEARAICAEWNATHPAGEFGRKAEYESA